MPPIRWSVGSRTDANPISCMYFAGSIDEPAIFNTALSAANISSLYGAAQIPPALSRPVTAPATAFKGSSLDLSVWAEGSPTLGYQWTSNGISLGVTATNLFVNYLQVGTQTFSVIVNNPYGSVTSSVTVAVSDAAPAFPGQPVSVARYAGRPFSFSVTASGTVPLSYQWKTNGTPIPGATSSSYGGVVSAALTGSYTCTASNETGMATSDPATLTLIPTPAGYGGAVLGSTPIAYWRLGESSGSVAYDYFGGNNGDYLNATLGEPGYSAIDSDTAVAFSGPDSFVGFISGTAINFEGTNTSFTLECWANGSEIQDGAALIAKGTGGTGTVPNEQFCVDVVGGNYHFFARRNDGVGTAFEATAAIGPNGTWQHIVAVYDQTNATMYLYVNGEESGNGGIIPEGLRVSAQPVNIGSKRAGNSPTYDNTFDGAIDEVVVYDHTLSASTVQAHYAAAYGPSLAPVIDIQPKPLTNYAGLPAKFSVAAHGTVPLAYQWKKDGVNIAGATLSSHTINPLAVSDAGDYSVGISNGVNPGVLSASAHLTVLTAPTSPPAIPGLVLHLPFNNNLTDVTGRGNNGVGIHKFLALGVPSSNVVAASFVPGQLGSGVSFATSGSGTNVDSTYVSLNDRPDFHFSSNVNFTVAFWIQSVPPNYVGNDLPFITTAVGSTFGVGLVMAYTFGDAGTPTDPSDDYPGGWAMSIFDAAGNGVGGRGEIGSVNDGNWHHLVHVFDRNAGNFNYLDGVAVKLNKQAGTSAKAAGNVDTGRWLTIGQDPTGSYGETGAGNMDDLGIWKKALTPLEAASIYIAGVSNLLSFTGAPFSLSVTRNGSDVILSWTVGVLQQADVVTGPYTDVVGARSPFTVSPTAAKKFYRNRL